MSAEGEKRRILEALGSIETLKNVSRSWPASRRRFPCAVVTLAGERRADEQDGAEYRRKRNTMCAALPDGNGSG